MTISTSVVVPRLNPSNHLAVIDRGKVLDYLLNEAHPDNGGKAQFFGLLGYSRQVTPTPCDGTNVA